MARIAPDNNSSRSKYTQSRFCNIDESNQIPKEMYNMVTMPVIRPNVPKMHIQNVRPQGLK